MRRGVTRAMLLLLVSGAILLDSAIAAPRRLMSGETGVLASGGSGYIALGVTKDDYDAFFSALRAKDEYGAKELVLSGRVFMVADKTACLVIDSSFLMTRVRILSGDSKNRAGWTAFEMVVPK